MMADICLGLGPGQLTRAARLARLAARKKIDYPPSQRGALFACSLLVSRLYLQFCALNVVVSL